MERRQEFPGYVQSPVSAIDNSTARHRIYYHNAAVLVGWLAPIGSSGSGGPRAMIHTLN